jgi:hypothetical protein
MSAIKFIVFRLANLVFVFAGLFIIPLALPFRRAYPETARRYTQYPDLGDWQLERLPGWASPWDNVFDGVTGDKRGWFANWCAERGYGPFMQRYIWTAIRNPANFLSRVLCGIDVSHCEISKIAGADEVEADQGKPGWQVLTATDEFGRRYFRLFAELIYPFSSTHHFLLDVGWKIKLEHNNIKYEDPPSERWKGCVMTISPWKEL